jgi:hypothetical protein
MKFQLVILASLILNSLKAQDKPYFQQQVDYKIDVSLNDVKHVANGNVSMVYTNNSPDQLKEIIIHLWANSHKRSGTDLAEQKLSKGSTDLYFAEDSELGGYSKLDFKVNDSSVKWKLETKDPDIAILTLNEPLFPGRSITISTPFLLKIPKTFSRLGHVGQSYQMTQWFPKPAVYDNKGWHPISYLDQGEFYSEFGKFEVSITLPENYVLASTGTMNNDNEKIFLENKIKESAVRLKELAETPKGKKIEMPFPESSKVMKTIIFQAENVHDFAWFADKRYLVTKDSQILASGKKIDTWAFFLPSKSKYWKNGAKYVSRAVEYYSRRVGEYPYPHATAVEGALVAGGGMEYPMITIIGDVNSPKSLDEVITHEVGHNWFYGILATNERDHPWMDEGMNSFYDHSYTKEYYGVKGMDLGLPFGTKVDKDFSEDELLYNLMVRNGWETPTCGHSCSFSGIGYGGLVYGKTAKLMKWLEAYLGTATFDKVMQTYYTKWKFRHPYPEDFRNLMESETGMNLSWWFDEALCTSKIMDAKILKVSHKNHQHEVVVKTNGIQAPVPVSAIKDSAIVNTQWTISDKQKGDTKKETLIFPEGDFNKFVIDPLHETIDYRRFNNDSKANGGLFSTLSPIKLGIIPTPNNSTVNSMYINPALGGNVYDGFMAGVSLYNVGIIPKKFEFMVVPMYGFKSKSLSGVANFKYNLFTNEYHTRKMEIGINARKFHYREGIFASTTPFNLEYYRLAPFVKYYLGNLANLRKERFIQLKFIHVAQQEPSLNGEGSLIKNYESYSNIPTLTYQSSNLNALAPKFFKADLEFQSYKDAFDRDQSYSRITSEYRIGFQYAKKKFLNARFWGGTFINNSRAESNNINDLGTRGSLTLMPRGFNDYRFEDHYFGRTEDFGFAAAQISNRDGGFKLNIPASERNNIGGSNKFAMAINLSADLPLRKKLPIRPYLDLGYFSKESITNVPIDNFIYSGGLTLVILKGAIEINLPMVQSKSITDIQKSAGMNNIFQRATFLLDINALEGKSLLKRQLVNF